MDAATNIHKFLCDLLDPEMYGHAVSEEVRGEARKMRAALESGGLFIPVSIPQILAMDAILAERHFQDNKHGPLSGAGGHTLGEWIIIAEEELAEARKALIKGGIGRDSLRSELIQVAAVLVACLEQHGVDDPHAGRQV